MADDERDVALAYFDQILKLENRIKLVQVKLLLDIKNVLKPEQQQELRWIMSEQGKK